MKWPKYWSFSFSISSSSEYSGLISFWIDWMDLLVVQGTLNSLLQHHSSKASILWRSAFFIVRLSHPYMTTGKTIALTRRTFLGKVMSFLFNMLSTTERLHFHFSLSCMEKEMATHSSILVWRIKGTGSLMGCCLWGRTESDTTEAT